MKVGVWLLAGWMPGLALAEVSTATGAPSNDVLMMTSTPTISATGTVSASATSVAAAPIITATTAPKLGNYLRGGLWMVELGLQARTTMGRSTLVPPVPGVFLALSGSSWLFDKGVGTIQLGFGPFSTSELVLPTGERWSPLHPVSLDLRVLWELPALVDGREERLVPVIGPQIGGIINDGGTWTAPPCAGRWRDDACQGALFSARTDYVSFAAHAVAGLIGTWSRFTVTILATVGAQGTTSIVEFDGVNTPAARALYRRIVDEHAYRGGALAAGLQLAVGFGFPSPTSEREVLP